MNKLSAFSLVSHFGGWFVEFKPWLCDVLAHRPYTVRRRTVSSQQSFVFAIAVKVYKMRKHFRILYLSKDVHLCFIMSPGKMIFAVLEL